MNLGEFSISLAVKNLDAATAFYEKLGFENITPPDIRALESELAGRGIDLELKAMEGEPGETGPAHATLTDPDGNLILIDQF